MKDIIYTIILSVMTYTFFGLIYPEYVLLPDTYEYIENNCNLDETDAIKDFYNILGASSGELTIKSQLLETLTKKIDMEGKHTCQTEKKKNQKTNHCRTESSGAASGYGKPWLCPTAVGGDCASGGTS